MVCVLTMPQHASYALHHTSYSLSTVCVHAAGSSRGRKGKGLSLSVPQEAALVSITGALRFLVLLDTNKVRLQQLGAIPALVTLATQASRPALRYDAQSILGMLACVLSACDSSTRQRTEHHQYTCMCAV